MSRRRSCSGINVVEWHNGRVGRTGEDLASAELCRRGYAILDRRYRTRHGEIDIVARDGSTLVFVEVKARSSVRFGLAAEAITTWKRRRIRALAGAYLAHKRLGPVPCRFDVVTIDYEGAGVDPRVDVIVGAF